MKSKSIALLALFVFAVVAAPAVRALPSAFDGTSAIPPDGFFDGTSPIPSDGVFDGTSPIPSDGRFDGTSPIPTDGRS